MKGTGRDKEEARYRTQSDQHVVATVMAEVEAEAVAKKVTEEKEAAAAVVERETVMGPGSAIREAGHEARQSSGVA